MLTENENTYDKDIENTRSGNAISRERFSLNCVMYRRAQAQVDRVKCGILNVHARRCTLHNVKFHGVNCRRSNTKYYI